MIVANFLDLYAHQRFKHRAGAAGGASGGGGGVEQSLRDEEVERAHRRLDLFASG